MIKSPLLVGDSGGPLVCLASPFDSRYVLQGKWTHYCMVTSIMQVKNQIFPSTEFSQIAIFLDL